MAFFYEVRQRIDEYKDFAIVSERSLLSGYLPLFFIVVFVAFVVDNILLLFMLLLHERYSDPISPFVVQQHEDLMVIYKSRGPYEGRHKVFVRRFARAKSGNNLHR